MVNNFNCMITDIYTRIHQVRNEYKRYNISFVKYFKSRPIT